ncbi:protein translocase subunit secE/sec61 gamma [Granulicatella balaenopterae]|uniref:Protein translocase subunit SecE n=1 Tax=Granulicatella balaenopterae TaxID=137733 RepID=A0A1H9PTP1_9LACT|nr:preprotein translocase subunit SecE [Granulicatella balaenopterae]SER51581.1 protein translocase subunit secE/sec61 gamma [Granulicatella balaenopterae]
MKFMSSVIQEMKLVTWPTGKKVTKYTITVIMTIVLAAGFFAIVDAGIGALFNALLSK